MYFYYKWRDSITYKEMIKNNELRLRNSMRNVIDEVPF